MSDCGVFPKILPEEILSALNKALLGERLVGIVAAATASRNKNPKALAEAMAEAVADRSALDAAILKHLRGEA